MSVQGWVGCCSRYLFFLFVCLFYFILHVLVVASFWISGCYGCRPFSPQVLACNFYRAWGSAIPLPDHFSSIVTDSRSRASCKSILHKKMSLRMYASVHSGELVLTKLTYTRLEDNLIRHRGDSIRVCLYVILLFARSLFLHTK